MSKTNELEQTVKCQIKAGMTAARKDFDKNPASLNWRYMLVWSLVWQQVCRDRGMDAAIQLHFEAGIKANSNDFAYSLLKALYPNESIDDLIRS